MSTRRSMHSARRARIFTAANGKCHICGERIGAGEPWEAEHIIALECGGTDEDSNLEPAHVSCHADKTRLDHKTGAKIRRIRKKHGLDPVTRKPPRKIASRGFYKPEGYQYDRKRGARG